MLFFSQLSACYDGHRHRWDVDQLNTKPQNSLTLCAWKMPAKAAINHEKKQTKSNHFAIKYVNRVFKVQIKQTGLISNAGLRIDTDTETQQRAAATEIG